MATAKKLVTKSQRLHTARQIIESLTEPANTAYYTFIGNHLGYGTATDIPQPNDSVYDSYIDVYRNMMFGKRVSNNDVTLVISRNDYISNKVYDMYDDRLGEANIALFDSNFYAVVNASAYYHVFKCLDNNNNANSLVQPSFADIDANDEYYSTSDGYVWKYMYSVDSDIVKKFATTKYFPVVVNNSVTTSAVDGRIDVIKVEDGGRGYDNYCNGVFRTDDLKVDGSSVKYSLNASNSASVTSSFYNGCYIYITSGTGAGQYSKIVGYTVNSSVKYITLETEFPIDPASDSAYEISPGVNIIGDGTQTINAAARAIVNTNGNSIYKVEMLNLGAGYKYMSATVSADNTVGVPIPAIVRPIYSPPGGHGYDVAYELGATGLCISTKFANSDVGIPLTNDYATIGILKDPTFSDVVINYDANTISGTFIPGEPFYRLQGINIASNLVMNVANYAITGGIDFSNQLLPNDYVYFKIPDNSSFNYQLASVNAVQNNTSFTIKTTGLYTSNNVTLYKTDAGNTPSIVSVSGKVITVATGTLITNNVSGILSAGDRIIGANSGAVATITSIERGGVSKNFNTFISMYKYKGQIVSGSFNQDELVFQSVDGLISSQFANAYYHSTVDIDGTNKYYYVTNQIGQFNVANNIIGANSTAVAKITDKYLPEIAFGTGEILFLENIESVTRSNTSTETIKFIFEF